MKRWTDVKVVLCIVVAMPGVAVAFVTWVTTPLHHSPWWLLAYLGTYIGLVLFGYVMRDGEL